MFEERNIYAAIAVVLFAYAVLGAAAALLRAPPPKWHLRRWWNRLCSRREHDDP